LSEKFEGILHGYTLEPKDRDQFHLKIGRILDPRVYQLDLLGHRILVAQDLAEEMYKGVIAKPKRSVDQEQREMGSGRVVAVGPLVGDGNSPHPTGLVCAHPTDLLGKQVFYQMYAGKVFRTDDDDEEFGGVQALIILTDRDVQAVNE
jgi:co-chaperonin GroES (HSP10)